MSNQENKLLEEQKAKAVSKPFQSTLDAPYRWRDWAAPFDHKVSYDETKAKKLPGGKRRELAEQAMGSFILPNSGYLFSLYP